MTDQLVIKVVLIIAFVAFAVVLIRSGSSARSQALRTVGLGIFLVAAILAVVFPTVVNDLAVLVGVGRGTDLLLYAFIVVFIGNSLSASRKRRAQRAQITALARRIALDRPMFPEKVD